MSECVPTIESVSNGLIKLVREVNALKLEVGGMTSAIKGFTEKHPLPYKYRNLPPESGATGFKDRFETDEPRSKIAQARFDYLSDPNLEIPTKTLLAISKDIDGAVRDIRAARIVLTDITEDSDSRKNFLDWQKSQKS